MMYNYRIKVMLKAKNFYSFTNISIYDGVSLR